MALVATLVANPSNPVVTEDLVSRLSGAAQTERTNWLATGIAADLVLSEGADGAAAESALRATIGPLPVDVVVQDAATRRKKALLADMDSTMIGQECIDELAAEVGLKDKVAAITARAMNGEIEFEPAVRERVALLKGLSIGIVDEIIEKRITLTPGGRTLIATMKANGGYAALVSGGFTVFTSRIAAMLGFDENRANILLEDGGKLTGHVADPILGREAKVEALHDVAAKRGISVADVMAVGDGANDLGMIKLAGSGVALHAKPKVAAEASIRIDHGDLTALLYIQGYRQEDFAP
ncbi:phosphoserine phosphatase SerB [Martelella mediterranea]|uniref:Phosphoserine phosphatase n=1 Tax=Martelella mediterranea DSM 17316 TaxID=1122214 RepID=A0A1U9Z2X9_9HYPH|nr:phosphoserine phosphatase SerB [Martelella mediterranea]AQZ52049.1 Phosphoserine phosphatase [Martelella mediterranea DSM 17316]